MSFTQLMRVSMKIAFIGEAVSGFGGMETVIRDVITTFRQQHIYSEMFFFCRNDKMDKGWLEGIKYSCSFSNIRLGFASGETYSCFKQMASRLSARCCYLY